MIQRIQTIWLLLAVLSNAGLFYFNLFSVQTAGQPKPVSIGILDGTSFLFLLSAIALFALLLSAGAIFLFKNRKRQRSLIWLAISLSFAFMALAIMHINNYSGGVETTKVTFGIACFLPVFSIIFLILAVRGINKDEKLVRSMDRLR